VSYRKIRIRDEVPLPLYRYTKKKWAERFFDTGQLRLGTLFDYAKMESYGDAVHDRHEGYCPFNTGKLGPSQRPIIKLILARNNLVLCMADSHNRYLYNEFEAECCIRINDDRFFKEIDKQLQAEFTSPLLRQVTYLDKTRWDTAPDYVDFAGAIKDAKFKRQREVRVLWEPIEPHEEKERLALDVKTKDNFIIDAAEGTWFKEYTNSECEWLSPRTVYVPNATKYCSLLPVA
jgi:hypothetical protein